MRRGEKKKEKKKKRNKWEKEVLRKAETAVLYMNVQHYKHKDNNINIIIIMTVISIAPYLTDKGDHTAFYKVYKKNSKIIRNHCVLLAHTTHTLTHTH